MKVGTPIANAPMLVDVIVPAFLGVDETRRNLESVLAHPQETPFELIVIDDCSPLPEVQRYLDQLADSGQITLIRNRENQGFVWSVNRGMALHPDRDVVLLNSDTEVHGAWVDRLYSAAYSADNVGTVSPFSNNATICSYPRFVNEGKLPKGWSFEELDKVFSRINGKQYIEIPTAVGFCMYIRRQCLNHVGYFDVVNYKRGYGEENDFCMRAMNMGFKHLLCGDTYVYHKGGVSFTSAGPSLYEEAQQTLHEMHPQYNGLVQAHIAQDPARVLRRRVDVARLMESPRQNVLFITADQNKDIKKHVRDLTKLLQDDHEILVLRPHEDNLIKLEWAREGEEFVCYFPLPFAYKELIAFLKSIQVRWAHVHDVSGFPQIILKIPHDLGIPYDVSLHDYYSVCPQKFMVDANGRYCGEPDAVGCNSCLSERPAPWGLDIFSWRAMFEELFRKADRIIAPSRDVLRRLERYLPQGNYMYFPNPHENIDKHSVATSGAMDEIKVIVLGGLNREDGVKLLEECAEDAKERGLPIFFHLIGAAGESLAQYPDVPLTISGEYEDDQLSNLIARERGDIIFFPTLWPITFSYLLSSAMQSGIPIAAPHLGAFPERLESYPHAHLLDWNTTAKEWNQFFLSLRVPQEQGRPSYGEPRKSSLRVAK
ncbi:MAG: glycosyltransferase [Gammaproteobacteria bacterium]